MHWPIPQVSDKRLQLVGLAVSCVWHWLCQCRNSWWEADHWQSQCHTLSRTEYRTICRTLLALLVFSSSRQTTALAAPVAHTTNARPPRRNKFSGQYWAEPVAHSWLRPRATLSRTGGQPNHNNHDDKKNVASYHCLLTAQCPRWSTSKQPCQSPIDRRFHGGADDDACVVNFRVH